LRVESATRRGSGSARFERKTCRHTIDAGGAGLLEGSQSEGKKAYARFWRVGTKTLTAASARLDPQPAPFRFSRLYQSVGAHDRRPMHGNPRMVKCNYSIANFPLKVRFCGAFPRSMYIYHGSLEHQKRLRTGRCHCASEGVVHPLSPLILGGLVRNPADLGSFLSTRPVNGILADRSSPTSELPLFIYAVNVELDIHIAPDGVRGQFNAVKHETLFHNADVLAAGEIWIAEGVVSDLNDFSGSYDTGGELQTNADFSRALLSAVDKCGVTISSALRHQLTQFSQP
jgi:hypothetical protein